jgi:hypothetical protein
MAPRAPLLIIKKVLLRVALVVDSYTFRGDSDLLRTVANSLRRNLSNERY